MSQHNIHANYPVCYMSYAEDGPSYENAIMNLNLTRLDSYSYVSCHYLTQPAYLHELKTLDRTDVKATATGMNEHKPQ